MAVGVEGWVWVWVGGVWGYEMPPDAPITSGIVHYPRAGVNTAAARAQAPDTQSVAHRRPEHRPPHTALDRDYPREPLDYAASSMLPEHLAAWWPAQRSPSPQ